MRTIRTCNGLGDACWIFQKLINAKEQFYWQIHSGNPQRGKQIFDLLPRLSAMCTYTPGLQYAVVNKMNVQRYKRNWSMIKEQMFYLSANEWLENGNKLVDFLPDLPISYKLNYNTLRYVELVQSHFDKSTKYIGIYGSSYSTSRSWGFWGAKEWFTLINKIHQEDETMVFVIIGAAWDMNLADELMGLLIEAKIKYINTVGKELGYVMEMMKMFRYAFYFPSGLPIISQTIEGGSDCMMFYPKMLEKMQGTWADPEAIKNKSFFETQFISPEMAFEWVKHEYKLFNQ